MSEIWKAIHDEEDRIKQKRLLILKALLIGLIIVIVIIWINVLTNPPMEDCIAVLLHKGN